MANGGHATLFQPFYTRVQFVPSVHGEGDEDPSWVFDDGTFEKMGALMYDKSSCLLGFYDKLSEIYLYH